jgi:putative transcription factor
MLEYYKNKNNQMFEHQDWNPVVFRNNNNNTNNQQKETVLRSKQTTSVKKLDDNPETFDVKRVDKELADAIKNKRCELKLTQAMLAQKVNEKPNVIQEVETMKAVYNHVIINKILKALGLSLKIVRNKK